MWIVVSRNDKPKAAVLLQRLLANVKSGASTLHAVHTLRVTFRNSFSHGKVIIWGIQRNSLVVGVAADANQPCGIQLCPGV